MSSRFSAIATGSRDTRARTRCKAAFQQKYRRCNCAEKESVRFTICLERGEKIIIKKKICSVSKAELTEPSHPVAS